MNFPVCVAPVRCLQVFAVTLIALSAISCSARASETPAFSEPAVVAKSAKAAKGATIDIKPNSPADTVRSFYTKLRERRFREAIYLTNLRPAIEGLTDDELKEFAVDFEAIAKYVPEDIEINGEIISGEVATVTARLPGDDMETLEFQEIRLRRSGDFWVILSADEETEQRIRNEGKEYFRALKIETHQDEARRMLERISKAQFVFSLQNEGRFSSIEGLIELGLLPADVMSAESTGYAYKVLLTNGGKGYFATATPAVYEKTGKLSFLLKSAEKGLPKISSRDNNGQPLQK
jgi:hypothetical protein